MANTQPRQAFVTSADGTKISVTVTGQGRPLVISPGALNTAQDWQLLADALAPHLTVHAVNRRGHGDSDDHEDHNLAREQDDIAAVLDLAGPDAILLGHSYGGIVSLGLALERPPAAFILYEPPVPVAGPVAGGALAPFERAVGDDDLDLALTLGLRHFVKIPDEVIEMLRSTPLWAPRAALTPGWVRELRAIDAFGADLDRFAALTMPTLLITGELSPPWLIDASLDLHRAIPGAEHVVIPGQAHD